MLPEIVLSFVVLANSNPGPSHTSQQIERTGNATRSHEMWPGATSVWDKASRKVRSEARCIVNHESRHAGLYHAENRKSSASGVAQWVDGTWKSQARRAGVKVRAHASRNSRWRQDRVFIWAIRHSRSAWSYSC